MGRILALDFGERRIGVALSDETKTIAQPLPYIATSTKKELLNFVKDKQVEFIILGLPRNLKGNETESSKKVRKFGEWLAAETKILVKYADERFSTKAAMHKIHEKNLKGMHARSEVDSLSAQILLETYLGQLKSN